MQASKKTINLLVAAAVLIGVSSPFAYTFAASHPEITPTHEVKDFCASLDKHHETIGQKVLDLDAKLDAKHKEHQEKITAKRDDFKQKHIDRRADHELKHEEIFTKLRAAAQSDEQKAAVEKFVTTVKGAVATRQAAVNNALNDHKAGIDAEFNSRWIDIDAAHAALKNATDAAFTRARTDCANGVDSQTVRANLHADLKVARQAFHDATKRTGAHHNIAKQHNQELKDAVHKTVEDYKATVAAAREELKAALGE